MLSPQQLKGLLDAIRASDTRQLKARIKHLYDYLERAASDNPFYLRYNSEIARWHSWPPLQERSPRGWSIPDSLDECKSLSFSLYATIGSSDHQSHVIPLRLFKRPLIVDVLNDFHDAFFPYLINAIDDIVSADTQMPATQKQTVTPDSTTIFVVHGRNDKLRKAMFAFLRSIGLRPLEWSQAVLATGKPSPYVGEILDAAFNKATAVLVLFTPDDEARLREALHNGSDPQHETALTPQARPNVIFEAGMALGRDQNRTVLVEIGSLRPFSDTYGRHVIRMDNSPERRQDLADRLKLAGASVDISGRDWHSEGDFSL